MGAVASLGQAALAVDAGGEATLDVQIKNNGATVDEFRVDNLGNVAFDADILGEDPDRLVAFEVEPPAVSVDPGTAGFAKVRVKPAQSFWRGPSKTRSFQVEVKPRAESQAPLVLAGTMLQEAILPPWFLRAVLTAIVLLVAA